MPRWIEIDEPHDLAPWQCPLRDPPAAMATALGRGVRLAHGPFTPFARLTDDGGDGVEDGVWRHPDATLTVACTTPMPGVNAAMWDWWFGWHSLSSARYRLWHPTAHIRSQLAEDRRHLPVGRPRYVGNISAVDEYIGPDRTRLAIGFVPPAQFGLNEAAVDRIGTAICATVAMRDARLQQGALVHLIENRADGCIMHSRFHLGQFRSNLPVVGPFISWAIDRPAVRRRAVSDAIGLALLRHCCEEMHHLAGLLADLHARFGTE
jgi:hypothetical protein